MDEPLRLAVIVGSTREGRFAPTVVRWFLSHLATRPDYEVDVIDLAECDLPPTWTHDATPGMLDYLDRLERADAFVVVTPEYNHGYPASLKHAIDLANAAWHAKPVAFVSYGGVSGGLRAVEQLRQVFAEVHAVGIRDCVSLHRAGALFDPDGVMDPASGADDAAKLLLDRLSWWGRALRAARSNQPYAA